MTNQFHPNDVKACDVGLASIALYLPCAVWSIQFFIAHDYVEMANGGNIDTPFWYMPLFISATIVGAYGIWVKFKPRRSDQR